MKGKESERNNKIGMKRNIKKQKQREKKKEKETK